MNCLNPFFAFLIYLIAFLTAYLLNLKYKLKSVNNRYETIDGLRGFLALGVFIHHVSIWRVYCTNSLWETPKSNLYNHLGQTSVALFFMITSFLFVSKLLNIREKEFNWKRFFISRIFRLLPMYYFSVLLVVLFVLIISDWQLKTSILDFAQSIGKWLTFTILKEQINASELTFIIGAGVVWSLPYEWLFYFSLPLISLFLLKKKPTLLILFISLAFVILFLIYHDTKIIHIYSFIGGAIAPFLIKYTSLKSRLNDLVGSIIIIVFLLLLLVLFKNTNFVLCQLLISVIFTLIALGCSVFGILKNSTIKFLGEICYSTYLIHGIILFTAIYFLFGINQVKLFSDLEYNLFIFTITPIVIFVSFLCFRFIEKPFIEVWKKHVHKKDYNTRSKNVFFSKSNVTI